MHVQGLEWHEESASTSKDSRGQKENAHLLEDVGKLSLNTSAWTSKARLKDVAKELFSCFARVALLLKPELVVP